MESPRRCYYYKGLLSSLPSSSSTPTPQLMVLTKSENKFDGFFHVFEEVSTVVCPINQRINSPKNSEKCRKSGEAFLSFIFIFFGLNGEKRLLSLDIESPIVSSTFKLLVLYQKIFFQYSSDFFPIRIVNIYQYIVTTKLCYGMCTFKISQSSGCLEKSWAELINIAICSTTQNSQSIHGRFIIQVSGEEGSLVVS